MKKVTLSLLVLIALATAISCTPQELVETSTEQSTDGEEVDVRKDPDA